MHPVGFLWSSDQLVAEAATYTTQQTQETNFRALSGIRNRDPNNQAAEDLRLRTHGHRASHVQSLLFNTLTKSLLISVRFHFVGV
jgi:hypothetical protein